jgi:hypothetical protein
MGAPEHLRVNDPINDSINNPINSTTLTPFTLSVPVWSDGGQRDALASFSSFLSFPQA